MRQRTHTIRLLLKYLLPSTLLLMSSIALAVTLNCDGVGCSFYVDFKNPGFYVIKATSPHQSNAGLWNLSLYLTTKTIPGGIHAGTTLMEDGITPGSIAFKLLSAQSISFRVWDYTQANVQVNVKVFQKRLFDECFDECLVYDNNVAVSENVITPQLQSGDYVIEVRALSNSTRSQFGISVEQPYVGDSLSV